VNVNFIFFGVKLIFLGFVGSFQLMLIFLRRCLGLNWFFFVFGENGLLALQLWLFLLIELFFRLIYFLWRGFFLLPRLLWILLGGFFLLDFLGG